MTTAERPPILDRLHDVLVVLLLALRPLCWDGAAGQPADIVWQALATAAFLLVALERAAGLRAGWAWSWRGIAGLALLAALLPAILRSPEPAPAWSFWTGLAASLAAAAYIAQVAAARTALVWSALGAGLAVTAVFGIAQPLLVLPAMAEAQKAGAGLFDALPGDAAAVAERIANGGAFATFTLANQFGSYLAMVIPVLAAMAWSSRGAARWTAAAVMVAGCAALAATGAKGAWLALVAACGVGWWLAWPGRWWRWLPLPLGAAGLAVLLLSGRAADSVNVRIGYWRSATAMVAEAPMAGHGFMGFAAHQPRLMQPGDEPTRYAHNETLEAAVAGGVPLALLLLSALALLAWPAQRREASAPAAVPVPAPALVWVLAAMIPYLALMHAFDGNLGWWPGGGGLGPVLGWSALLGIGAALVATALLRAAAPPAWAVAAGLAGMALKSCIDFDLHAMGIVGTAACMAAAAGPQRETASPAGRWLPLAGALLLAALVASGIATGLRLAEAEGLVAEARQLRDPQAARSLADRLGVDPATPRGVLAAQAGLRAWELAAGAPAARLACLDLLPPAPQTREFAEQLAMDAPTSAATALRHASTLVLAREWNAAAAEAERAVALAPTSPRTLRTAAELIGRVADALPQRADLRGRATALQRECDRLAGLVHPTLRLKE